MHTVKPTAKLIIAALAKRGIVVDIFYGDNTMLGFEYRHEPHFIIGCNPDISTASSFAVARDKQIIEYIARRYSTIPLPDSLVYTDIVSAESFMIQQGSIVVKPVDGAHGNGITVGVDDKTILVEAIRLATTWSVSGTVLLQQQVVGRDVRVMVIDGEVAAAVYRDPASVIGDGVSTIAQRIIFENQNNQLRGDIPYEQPLNKISFEAAENFLGDKINSIAPVGKYITVVGTANIGTGGLATECLSELPSRLIEDAVRAAQLAGCFCCGVDFMYNKETGDYVLIEINSSPSFGLHVHPSYGASVPVADIFANRLLTRYDYLLDNK